MKMKLLTSLVFLYCSLAFAQAPDTLWTRTYGGDIADYGRSVQLTTDNGYIIAGMTMSFGDGHRALVIKTDENGDTLWTRTFGGGNIDEASSLEQTVDRGYIIVGSTNTIGMGNFDILLIKTDEYGEEIWTKTFGGILDDFGSSVQQTTDSGYVLIGSTESFASGMQDIWLIKTDVNGNVIWDKRFGWTDYAGGSDVQQTTDGGYIVSGFSPSIGGWWSDFWLIKTDANGDTLWTKTFGGTDLDFSSSVQQTIDGGYIITGRTESFGAGGNDVWLIKTDESGDSLWTRTFGGLNGDGGKSVKQTVDRGYIIAGYTWSYGNGVSDVWLIKVDENGNEIWNKTLGLIGEDSGTSIQLTEDGGYILTGTIYLCQESLKFG